MNDKVITNDSLKDAVRQRLIGLIRKPAQEAKKKRPANMSWLALLGFNGSMMFLDLISGVTVGLLVGVLYGILTFIAGFLALLLHERLFTNAHAQMRQKFIAVGGGLLAIVSTFGIGILAGLVNVFSLGELVSTQTLEVVMIVALVSIASIHGILWGVYYFTDQTHIAEMNRLVNLAFRDQQRQGLDDAKEDVAQVKVINDELEAFDKRGELELLTASYKNLRGTDLVTLDNPAGVMTEDGFTAFRKDAPAVNFLKPQAGPRE